MKIKSIILFLAFGLIDAHAQQVQLASPHAIVTLTVVVSQDNGGTHYSLNGTDYPTADAVMAAAAAQIKDRPGSPVLIQGAKDVPYNAIAQLLDEGRNHGISSLSFATKSDVATPTPPLSTTPDVAAYLKITLSATEPHTEIVDFNGVLYPVGASSKDRLRLELDLTDHLQSNPNGPCVIHAAPKIDYHMAKDLVDLCRKVGYRSVNLYIENNIPATSLVIERHTSPVAAITWASIFFGIAFAVVSLIGAVIVLAIFLLIRRKRERHEKELRRMASLDS